MTPFYHSSFSEITCDYLEQNAGDQLPKTDKHQLFYIKSGKLSLRSSSHMTELQQKQIFVLPANCDSKIYITTTTLLFQLNFNTDDDLLLSLFSLAKLENCYIVKDPLFTTQILERLLLPSFDLEKSSLLQFLLAPIIYQIQENCEDVRRLLPVLDYIEKNIQYSPRIEELAKILDLDKNYFTLFFRSKMKLSPGQYIQKRKIQVACQMLQNQQRVSQITSVLGFYDTSHFCRIFKKEMDETPKSFIKRMKQKN